MKITLSITLLIVLFSCNPFEENRVLNYETELSDLVVELEGYNAGTYDLDEIDEFNIDKVRSLDIDLIIKNDKGSNPFYSGFVEENDSLIILVKKSSNIFENEKRIIYDYATNPRNFGSEELIGASYSITQLNERIYFSELGFD